MNTERLGDFQGFGSHIDVFFDTARQGAHTAVFNLTGDGLNGFKITWRRNGKANFHYINTHTFQGQCDLQLLFHAQARLQRLFTIT